MISLILALMVAPLEVDDNVLRDLEAQQQAIFDRVAPSVVYISGASGYGSGFFVSRQGHIVTNAHVVGPRDNVTVILLDGSRHIGKVVERAPDGIDLALVQIELESVPLPLVGRSLRVGSWAAAVGHGSGGIWAFTTGMITNIYPHQGERPVLQTQIPLNPGNSGGPVVDREGRVIGIVTARLKGSDSINFAIRTEVALRSLTRLRRVCECLTIRAPEGVPILVDGAMVGQGPEVLIPADPRTYLIQAVVGGKLLEKKAAFPTNRSVTLEPDPSFSEAE